MRPIITIGALLIFAMFGVAGYQTALQQRPTSELKESKMIIKGVWI